MIEYLFPRNAAASLDSLQSRVDDSRRQLAEPFGEPVMQFFAKLSESLFAANRDHQYPELQALAFWMRPAAMRKMRDQFVETLPADVIVAPRGVSFHVTPSNVDTMPMYSLLLSLICGNSNVVRVSSRSGPQFQLVCDCIDAVLSAHDDFDSIANLITLLKYDRNEVDVTKALSSLCDTRVLWGGDAAIQEIRRASLPIDASEIVFPDRTSWAVMRADYFHAADDQEREQIFARLFNDTLALDQLACSSPQVLVLVGNDQSSEQASESLWPAFDKAIVKRGYAIEATSTVDKFAAAWQSAIKTDPVVQVWQGEKLTVVKLNGPATTGYSGCGSGFFFELRCKQLSDLVALVDTHDQTLTYAGFDRVEIKSLAEILRGRGFTRFVPFGAALEFNHLWEGVDLLRTFTKLIHIR